MIRINREFCLTDSTVNCYGYRLLTSGLQLDRFRPAVGFLQHERERGVAVQWTDFRVEGDALYAVPVVNDTLFPNLAQQIEEGFINAASVGHIVALSISDRPEDKLPGQDGPTVLEWFPREVSLVDIPGNYNALGRLYDENDNLLHDLSAHLLKPSDMNFKEIFPDLRSEDDDTLRAYLTDLKQRAERADALQAELDRLRADADADVIRRLLDKAMDEHRISAPAAECLAADYAGRPKALEALLSILPARKAVPTPTPRPADQTLASLTWDELDRRGLLPRLKAENPDLFAAKFRERFNTSPND